MSRPFIIIPLDAGTDLQGLKEKLDEPFDWIHVDLIGLDEDQESLFHGGNNAYLGEEPPR